MDQQNSRGRASRLRSTRAILHYASELKVDIQSQVHELIASLKKRERELCVQVDRQCLEQLCEAEECGAYYEPQIDESYCTEEDDPNENCYFTTRLEFHTDFKNSKRLLQNFGQLKKFNCSNKIACDPQIDKNQLPKGPIYSEIIDHFVEAIKSFEEDSGKKCGDPAESFEFVDSVECLSSQKIGGKCQKVAATLPKNLCENISEEKEDLEVFEKVSSCSVDSFDVIQTDCCGMNDLSSNASQTELPSTTAANVVNQASCSKRNSSYPTFYLPNLQRREQKDNDWLARIVRHLPKEKSKAPAPTPTEEAMSGIQVLPTATEGNVADEETMLNKLEKLSIGRERADTPSDMLLASFRAYLQKGDLSAWVHSNRESGESNYEQWVVRGMSPCISKTSIINAFSKQLKSFVM